MFRKICKLVLFFSLLSIIMSCGENNETKISERSPNTERGLVLYSLSNTIDLNNSGNFLLGLQTNPGKPVTVTINHTELSGNSTVTPYVELNSTNWESGKPVTIEGVCDALTDNATYALSFTANNYPSSFKYLAQTFTNGDNSTLERGTDLSGNYADNLTGIIYEADKISLRSSQNFTTESNGNSTIYIRLCKPPSTNVNVSLAVNDSTEAQLSSNSVTFSTGNWSTETSVNVLGIDDSIGDGNIDYQLTASSAGYPNAVIDLQNIDNESYQIITSVEAINSIQEGNNGSFDVSLSASPNSDVVIPIMARDTPASSSSSRVTVSPSSLTFSSGNFSTPQTVTINATNDSLSEGLESYYIYLGPVSTADVNYSSIPTKTLLGKVYD